MDKNISKNEEYCRDLKLGRCGDSNINELIVSKVSQEISRVQIDMPRTQAIYIVKTYNTLKFL